MFYRRVDWYRNNMVWKKIKPYCITYADKYKTKICELVSCCY